MKVAVVAGKRCRRAAGGATPRRSEIIGLRQVAVEPVPHQVRHSRCDFTAAGARWPQTASMAPTSSSAFGALVPELAR